MSLSLHSCHQRLNPLVRSQSRAVYLAPVWLDLRDLALEIQVSRLSTAILSAIVVKD